MFERLCAESNVVGFELVELLPYRVTGYETELNSERIVRECLAGITMRKKGIANESYLAPLTVDDARKQDMVGIFFQVRKLVLISREPKSSIIKLAIAIRYYCIQRDTDTCYPTGIN